jgi:hypothetical protein
METETQTEIVTYPCFADLACAIEADLATDPDGETVSIRAAYRDLNGKGNGSQTYRRFRYPGMTTEVWPDCERLPRLGGNRASDRRCSKRADVPVGTLVVDFESSVNRYHSSRATVHIGIVCRLPDGKSEIVWLEHRSLKSRPVYEVRTPARGAFNIARRDDGDT